MTAKRAAQPVALSLLYLALLSPVAAEPLTSGAGSPPAAVATPDAEPGPRRSTAISTPPQPVAPGNLDRSVAAGDVPNTSKTVELLLELQGRNPGLAAGERPKAELPTAQPNIGAAGAGKPAFGGEPGLPFGGVDALRSKPNTGDPQAVDWTAPPPSQLGGVLSSAGGGAGSREAYRPAASADSPSGEGDLRWFIPRAVVRFVRENRDMVVLGSVALLVLLWALTAMASKRRK
jgi:hypothetical protein